MGTARGLVPVRKKTDTSKKNRGGEVPPDVPFNEEGEVRSTLFLVLLLKPYGRNSTLPTRHKLLMKNSMPFSQICLTVLGLSFEVFTKIIKITTYAANSDVPRGRPTSHKRDMASTEMEVSFLGGEKRVQKEANWATLNEEANLLW